MKVVNKERKVSVAGARHIERSSNVLEEKAYDERSGRKALEDVSDGGNAFGAEARNAHVGVKVRDFEDAGRVEKLWRDSKA